MATLAIVALVMVLVYVPGVLLVSSAMVFLIVVITIQLPSVAVVGLVITTKLLINVRQRAE